MSSEFEVKTLEYSGPLAKLLELIEERRLDITQISLAKVTDSFIKYLETVREIEPAALADFILIASKLIFIKSKYLLPELELGEEETAEIKDLENRLKLYQEVRLMSKFVSKIWKGGAREFGRSYFLSFSVSRSLSLFYPGSNFDLERVRLSLENLVKSLERFKSESQIIKEKIISLEEKVKEINLIIQKLEEVTFNNLSKAKDRSHVIAAFLAILHLAREQIIFLEQAGNFSDIIIRKKQVQTDTNNE